MARLLILLAGLVVLSQGPPGPPASGPAVLPEPAPAAQQHDDLGSPRFDAPLTILQLNDVYSTEPVDGRGGLARVATLKRRLAAEGRTPFVMLAGDFLSSSVESTIFQGEQMVAALNAAGLDLATLGNHEFDFGIDVLLQRMREAKWQWVVSNVIDTRTGRPVGGAAPFVVRTFGTLKVGFIGLCLASEGMASDRLANIRLIDPIEAAAAYLPILRKEQVQVVIALTHLSWADDRALAERFPDIDVIVGGHEHFPITAVHGRTLISKSGSDAKSVARIDVNRRGSAPVERYYELIPITSAIEDDPQTAAIVSAYTAKLGPELDKEIGASRVPLAGAASRLRVSETNLGNLVADAVRAAAGAQASIVNSGGIRGDREHAPGPIRRRTIIEIHPFGNVVCTLAVPGRVILEALEHGVSRLPASAGQFPQVSGLTFGVDPGSPAGRRVANVRVGGVPLDLERVYTLAIPDFLLNGGDGYTMFAGQQVLVPAEEGPLMALALERYIAGKDVTPSVEGRIAIAR
jgi:5'-nucleotidase